MPVVVRLLRSLFWTVCAWRLVYPFYNNPLDWRHSDPGRHWENGLNFLNPHLFGSVDAKVYQLWVYVVAQLSDGDSNKGMVALLTGVLCAALPIVWYRVSRELLNKPTSYLFAITIGIFPSFVAIYSFFMNETLLLVLIGASFWLSLRAIRKKTFASFALALVLWVLTSYTRIVALPFAALSIAYMLYYQPRIKGPILLTIMLYVLVAIPSAYHSHIQLNVGEPFQFRWINKIYHKVDSAHHRFISDKGVWQFASPSFFVNPLEPFYDFKSFRENDEKNPYTYRVNTKNGVDDWKREYEKVSENYSWEQRWMNWYENAVYLLFSPSWPDYTPHGSWSDVKLLNYHLRWIWAPLILCLILIAPFTTLSEKRSFILMCTWTLLMLLLFQQSGVMEGRYRKPVEPLILLSVFILFSKQVGKDNMRPAAFIYSIYLKPVIDFMKNLKLGSFKRG